MLYRAPKIKIETRKTENPLQMHFLEMPLSLCPVLFVKKAGCMSETEEILLGVELVDGYKIFIEDSG